MIFEVRLRPEAELDLADAALWYEEHSRNWGTTFLMKLSRFYQPSQKYH